MPKKYRRISEAFTVLTMTALILTGCTSEASSISSARDKADGADMADTGFTLSTVGSYDSADTAVVVSTDETNKAVTFINMETGKQYTLYYNGTTYVKDKYDGPMTISQIQPGDVVDVTFLKGKKLLASIKLSSEAWVYDDVYNYDLAGANRTATIGSQTYSLPEGVVVLSEGRRVDKAEVVSQDVVTISGIEHKIYSINVDKGHGYLSLKNEQPLLGGWIEVGNSVIRQITEDMLLVVPEGTYQVVLNNNGIGCVKDVTIERDKEVVLDVDDIEIPEDATGKILFSVTPENATVSVDGKPVDISKVVELPYGIHRVEASASGYDTLTKHIQVGSEYATISFKLEETRKEDSDSVSGNSVTRDPWKYEDTYPDGISDNSLSSMSENALRSSKNGIVDVKVVESGTTETKELKGVTVRLEIEDSNKKILSPRLKTSPCSFSKEKDAHKYRFILSMDGYGTKTFEPVLEEYQKSETLYIELGKQDSSTSTNSTTSSEENELFRKVTNAIAAAGVNCELTEGEDAYIVSDGKGGYLGHLMDSGVKVIRETIEETIKEQVGKEGKNNYSFTVKDNVPFTELSIIEENGNYKGKISITVNGKEVLVPVEIKKKEEEPEPDQPTDNKITVSVSAQSTEVKQGDTVKFTAEVKQGDSFVPYATVQWEATEGDEKLENWEEFGINQCSVSVKADATGRFTVKATYTDADGNSSSSDPITVEISQSNSEEGEEVPAIPPESSESEGSGDPTVTSGENGSGLEEKAATPNGLIEETIAVTQEAHPIRNFFSSLFK